MPKRPLFTVVVVNSGQNTPPQSLYWWSKPVYPQTRAAEESGSFLEQDSTAVPKFAFRSFCPCGILLGSAFPKPCLCGLRRLKIPQNIFIFQKQFPSHPVFLLLVRGHHAQKGGFTTMKTIQHAAPQPGSQDTHDRGRICRVCGKAFCLQHEPSRVYPASHNRGSHTPHHNRFPVNDELLAAVGKLTAEYGRIGGNLKPDSPDAERVAQPLPAACRGGTGGGFRPCCPKV